MKKSACSAFGPVLATVCALHLFCIGFDSPSSPDKTSVSVVFMASNSEIYQNALVDSVGKEIRVGAALYLPENFDSVEIRVLDNGSTVTDTVFRTFRTDYFKDTVWISYTFLKPGVKNVTVTPFVTPARSSLGATITIHGIEPTPRDTITPVLSLVTPPDTNATITTDTFTIDLQCSDSSGVASVSADMGAKTFQATMKNGHYVIPITGFASGEINVVTIHATDSSAAGNTISRKLYFDYQPITHPVKYKIVYNGNGNTGGTIPVDSNTYEALATVTVKENTGALVTSGYSFTGWNTAAAGDGALYAEGATFIMGSADVILYAQWAVNRYTVAFNSMEGSVVTSQAVDHGGNITEPAAPIRTGYIFGGWYEDKTYASIWNFTTGTIAANDTLYAKWNAASYTVTFDGQSVVTNSTMQVTFPKTTIDTLPAPIASGYRFDGWYTGSNGGGSPFLATTVVTSDITVYAKWTHLYRVTYDVNGGTGTVTVDPNTYQNSNTVMVLSGSGLSKTDYTFAGWNTQADTLGTSYNSGGPLIMGSADVTLYAKWRMNAPTISALSSKTCPVNDSVTFLVTATGLDLRYTWHMNNSEIENANGASYTTSKLTADEVSTPRTYKCVVTNPAGNANSSATLSASTVSDIEGNVYHEVKIGSQIWTMENLRMTKYIDGTAIPHVIDSSEWTGLSTPGYCFYNNSTSLVEKEKWGALYNWYVVDSLNPKKVAPPGWHIPTDEEWTILENYLIANGYNWDGTTSGNKIGKALAAKTDWNTTETTGAVGNDLSINNSTGFSALAGGYRQSNDGGYYRQNNWSGWWSATENNETNAWGRRLFSDGKDLGRSPWDDKKEGSAIRLVRD